MFIVAAVVRVTAAMFSSGPQLHGTCGSSSNVPVLTTLVRVDTPRHMIPSVFRRCAVSPFAGPHPVSLLQEDIVAVCTFRPRTLRCVDARRRRSRLSRHREWRGT
jgi:hypothetical protein